MAFQSEKVGAERGPGVALLFWKTASPLLLTGAGGMDSSREASSQFSPLDLEQQRPDDASWWRRLVASLRPGKGSSQGFSRLRQDLEEEATGSGKGHCMHADILYCDMSIFARDQ